ncbi:hypothetical protein GOBAR_AA04413 [Gossypium barbadense]|uniref:Uncharacterized protein n=1 Tax=Gossypium barbadense TaxID=3634 RepID=A0A2P5YKQ8_GOSBA|nr:hypothetical protein GOBAR_AA04413 [Gossypium barbadense]
MDGPIIMGSMIITGKVDLYTVLLGKFPDKFEGGQILINWLKNNFDELLKDQIEEVKEQYAQEYIMRRCVGSRYRVGVDWWLPALAAVVDVGRQGVIGSVSDGGNARIRPGVAAVRVEAMNFAATMRPKGAAQGGHLMITWHGSEPSASRICYYWRQGVGKFGRRSNVDHHSNVGGDTIARQMSIPNTMSRQTPTYTPPSMMILVQTPMQQLITMSMLSTFPKYPGFRAPYGYMPIVTQTPRASLFYEGGSLSQRPDAGVVDTRWQARTTQQSTTEEVYDAANLEETITQGAALGTYSGDDDDKEEVYRPTPPNTSPVVRPIVHKNPSIYASPRQKE